MIEGVDKSPIGHLDLGSDRDERKPLCTKHAWCLERPGHAGLCDISARMRHPEADYGPTRKR